MILVDCVLYMHGNHQDHGTPRSSVSLAGCAPGTTPSSCRVASRNAALAARSCVPRSTWPCAPDPITGRRHGGPAAMRAAESPRAPGRVRRIAAGFVPVTSRSALSAVSAAASSSGDSDRLRSRWRWMRSRFWRPCGLNRLRRRSLWQCEEADHMCSFAVPRTGRRPRATWLPAVAVPVLDAGVPAGSASSQMRAGWPVAGRRSRRQDLRDYALVADDGLRDDPAGLSRAERGGSGCYLRDPEADDDGPG